jgi:hypothetical protein
MCPLPPPLPVMTVPSGTTVTMTCLKSAQHEEKWTPSGFNVFIQAASGASGCSDSERVTRPITVNAKPVVTVHAADVTVCEDAGNAEVELSVVATAGGSSIEWVAGNPVASAAGVTCTGTSTGIHLNIPFHIPSSQACCTWELPLCCMLQVCVFWLSSACSFVPKVNGFC